MNGTESTTYADHWRDPINETYHDEARFMLVVCHELSDAEVKTALKKAAQCLRNGATHTFTGAELDVVRHLMPAHEVHQSGAVRWVLDNYGREEAAR